MKPAQYIISLLLILLCNSKASAQDIPIPEGYTLFDTAMGDLDKDGIPELAVAYNTRKKTDDELEDIPRALIIYKQQQGQWQHWQQSQQALYSSRGGGMMGDPFEDMEIRRGLLIISQSGGSTWKWGHTDTYRYQDGVFYLIGYTSNAGKLCEYWENVDYNLSTGKMIVTKEYETCEGDDQKITKRENETLLHKNLKITLAKRSEQEIKIVTPKYKHEVYVATKMEGE